MNERLEHRGISFAIPRNDDGARRWMITYSKVVKNKAVPVDALRPVYATRAEAVAVAKRAIDAMLEKKKRLRIVA